MRAFRLCRLAVWIPAVLTAASLSAQQTWPVANQQELLAALAAAAPGDVIQLTPAGVFQGFTLTTGLTLRGPATIGGNYPSTNTITATIPAGQLAQFVDIGFVPSPTNPPYSPDQGWIGVVGNARFDHCTIYGASGGGALALSRANVLVQGCTIVNYRSAAGIRAVDSHVSIHDSWATGSSASYSLYYSSSAAAGIECSGSGSLHLSSSTVTGGAGRDAAPYGHWLPADGLVTSVPTWISDTTVRGGRGDGPNDAGGDGLVATAATYARCSFLGGVGTPPGQPIVGTALPDPTLLGASTSGPLRMGQQVALRWLADQPGVAVGVLVTSGVRAPILEPVVTQPLWLGDVTFLLAVGVTSSVADFPLSLLVPTDPSLTNVPCDFVGFRLGGAGLQIAPLMGGVIR